MSDSDGQVWDQPALTGQEHLRAVLDRCAGQSFLVTAEYAQDAEAAAWLLAGHWSGHGGDPSSADVVRYRQPKMETLRDEVIGLAHLSPLAGRRKAIVLELVEEPRPEHSNILLKLTEEPPPHLGMFVAVARRARLPGTLRSRLFHLPLRPVAQDRLADWLRERHQIPAERARRAAMASQGWPLRALALARAGDAPRWPALRESLQKGGLAGLAAAGQLVDGLADLLDALEREFAAEEGGDRPFYRRARWHVARARRHLAKNANRRLVVDNLLSQLAADLAAQTRGEAIRATWPTW